MFHSIGIFIVRSVLGIAIFFGGSISFVSFEKAIKKGDVYHFAVSIVFLILVLFLLGICFIL